MGVRSIEVSAPLAAAQLQRVGGAHPSHRSRYSVRNTSALDRSAWGREEDSLSPCFVLMLEVLDNLPHDRVERKRSAQEWKETRVQEEATGGDR